MLKELGYTFSLDDLYWHELRIFNIIDREWKTLEANEQKKASRRRR
jgi:hypothetical protein